LARYDRLQQIQAGIRIEQMRQLAVEREMHLIAKPETEALFGGQVHRSDPQYAVLAARGNVDVQFAAHHFGNVDLRRDRALVAVVDQHDVLRTDAEHDLHRLDALVLQCLLHLLRQIDERVFEMHDIFAARHGEFRIEEVHLRRADESCDEEVRRMVEHILRRADLLDEAVLHNDDPIAQRHGFRLIVGNVNERGVDLLAEFDELSAHLVTEFCVEVRQRLVHEEDLRFTDDCTADGDTLTLAAGERFRFSLEIFGDAEDLRRFLDLFVDLRLRGLAQFESERHVFVHGHVRIQRVVLENHRDVAVFRCDVVDESVADVEFAFGDLFQSGDHAQSRRLAAAGRPDEYDELLVRDIKIEFLNRDHVFVVDLLDVFECYVCHVFSALSGATTVNRPTRDRPHT